MMPRTVPAIKTAMRSRDMRCRKMRKDLEAGNARILFLRRTRLTFSAIFCFLSRRGRQCNGWRARLFLRRLRLARGLGFFDDGHFLDRCRHLLAETAAPNIARQKYFYSRGQWDR